MDFETIEDAIIAELKAQVAYLKTVETYAGQIDRELDGLPVRFPAAYVSFGGSGFSPGDVGASGHREAVDFSVLVCARHLGGQDKARKETGGAYDVVKDVLAALANKNLGLDIEPIMPVRASLLFAGRETAVYEVEFSTEFQRA
jgi:phage gp37-like protein